ncbi:MAG: VWA domain-containing protein [Candidatus Bipolaricaulota bacterium]|nr:VWA domain-containing protein [Candidatus Bipolaricaulota bacterium]
MKRRTHTGLVGRGVVAVVLAVLIVTTVLVGQPTTYFGITYPQGDRSFADRVVEYVAASCVRDAFDDPEEALGPPDATPCGCHTCNGRDPSQSSQGSDQGNSPAVAQGSGVDQLRACSGCDTNAVALGFRLSDLDTRGFLTVEFIDNSLVDGPGPDLFIYITNDHPARVEISEDGVNFVFVGQTIGYPGMIDIAPYASADDRFRFVRLSDVPADENHSECAGPSIDAIGAMGPAEEIVVGEEYGSLELQPAGELMLSLSRAPDSLLLMLDTSSSMGDLLEGQVKIDVAKTVIIDLVNTLPPSMYVGMRSFGGCSHSEVISKIVSEPNLEWFKSQVRAMKPNGATPLAYALDLAKDDFADAPGTKLILLVSDGMETCGGNPVEAARQLITAGYDLRIDVVGFSLGQDNKAREQLMEIAKTTNGLYFDANNSAELRAALSVAVAFTYTVYDAAGNVVYAGTLGDQGPKLPAGTYRVVINTSPEIVLEQVVISDQQTTTIKIERSDGGYQAAVGG